LDAGGWSSLVIGMQGSAPNLWSHAQR
jgi:hypothetical protein